MQEQILPALEHEQNASTSQEEGLTQEQIALFEWRYANGYDLCHDSAYNAWLHQKQLSKNNIMSSDSLSDQRHDEQQDDLLGQNAPTNSADDSMSPSTFMLFTSRLHQSYSSLKTSSDSLSETRQLLSELSKYMYGPEAATNSSKSKRRVKSTARVLTSQESLTTLVEKHQKK